LLLAEWIDCSAKYMKSGRVVRCDHPLAALAALAALWLRLVALALALAVRSSAGVAAPLAFRAKSEM